MDYGRYKGGILGLLGGDPEVGIAQSIYRSMKRHQQKKEDALMQSGMDHTIAMHPWGEDQSDGEEPMAGGRLVTHPTRAILGEGGPEMVVPLTPRPGQKISPNMLRYRR